MSVELEEMIRGGMLGVKECKRLQAAGWGLSDQGVQTADEWLVWGTDPEGNLRPLWLADPEKYPEKWMDGPVEVESVKPQLELFA